MKPKLPINNELLLQTMLQYLPQYYFPEAMDDDSIHTLAGEEFVRLKGIMRRLYDTGEEENDSDSPFDYIEDDFKQTVYSRIHEDPQLLQLVNLRKKLISQIQKAVQNENNIIGTFYQNKGVHFNDDEDSEEYHSTPIIVVNNQGFNYYGGYEATTIYELFINDNRDLLCTLSGESGDFFDEPIENVQVEGLLSITHWLKEYGFLVADEQKEMYAA